MRLRRPHPCTVIRIGGRSPRPTLEAVLTSRFRRHSYDKLGSGVDRAGSQKENSRLCDDACPSQRMLPSIGPNGMQLTFEKNCLLVVRGRSSDADIIYCEGMYPCFAGTVLASVHPTPLNKLPWKWRCKNAKRASSLRLA
jgi:hypothetical protein